MVIHTSLFFVAGVWVPRRKNRKRKAGSGNGGEVGHPLRGGKWKQGWGWVFLFDISLFLICIFFRHFVWLTAVDTQCFSATVIVLTVLVQVVPEILMPYEAKVLHRSNTATVTYSPLTRQGIYAESGVLHYNHRKPTALWHCYRQRPLQVKISTPN